jgi:hypothetical protein
MIELGAGQRMQMALDHDGLMIVDCARDPVGLRGVGRDTQQTSRRNEARTRAGAA